MERIAEEYVFTRMPRGSVHQEAGQAFAMEFGSWRKPFTFWASTEHVIDYDDSFRVIPDVAAGPINRPNKTTVVIEISVTHPVDESRVSEYQSLSDLQYIVIVNIGSNFTYGTPSTPDISVRIYDNSAPNRLIPKKIDLKNCTSFGICSYTFSAVKLYYGHQVPAGTKDFVFDMYFLRRYVELAIEGSSR